MSDSLIDIKPGTVLIRKDGVFAVIILTISWKIYNNKQFALIKFLNSKNQIKQTGFFEHDLKKFFIFVASAMPT